MLHLGAATRIMGILNVTPDSFSGDGVLADSGAPAARALRIARRMIKAGADIIDVGGESTRPGAAPISIKDEIRRVVPVVSLLASKTDAIISVDTYKPAVARAAFSAGAHILNVIQGVPVADELLLLCRHYGAAIIVMHMRGTPSNMQTMTDYSDVVEEVAGELKKSVAKCRRFGLNENSIVVDPGIGFAKTTEQNLLLLRNLQAFKRLGCPVLVGTSRKSFIGKLLGQNVHERLPGTTATVACAIYGGAHIVRVHDVVQMKQVAVVTDSIINAKPEPVR